MKKNGTSFSLLGKNIQFSEEQLRYYTIRNTYNKFIYDSYIKANNEFSEVFQDFDDLHEKGPAWFISYLNPVVKYAVTELGKMKYYDLDIDAFIQLMDTSCVDKALNRVLAAKAEVEAAEEERENARAARTDAACSAWSGGGFGVSGAIKGAATAGALNLGGAAVSGIFNMVGRGISACANAAKLNDFLKSKETKDDYLNTVTELLFEVRSTFISVAEKNCKGFKVQQIYETDKQLSERILKNIKTGVVAKEDVLDNAVRAIQAYPYSEEMYKYLAENYCDPDYEIEDLALFFEYDISKIKSQKLDDFFKTMPKKTEKQMLDARKILAQKAKELGIKNYKIYQPLENMIIEYDRQARTFNGIEYKDRETAKKHSSLFEYFQKMDLDSEQKALDARNPILAKAKELQLLLDNEQYEPLEKIIKDYDIKARTAGGKVYKTREEADLQRRYLQLADYFKSLKLKTEAEAISARVVILEKAQSLKLPSMKKYDPLEQLIIKLRIHEQKIKIALAFKTVKHNKIYIYPDMPADKLSSAVQSYNTDFSDDDVVVMIDDTFFGGCEDGMIITGDSLYIHDSKTTRIDINKPLKVIYSKGWTGSKIFINGEQIGKLSITDENVLKALCQSIQDYSSNSVPPTKSCKKNKSKQIGKNAESSNISDITTPSEKSIGIEKKTKSSKAGEKKGKQKSSEVKGDKVEAIPQDLFSGINDSKIFIAPNIPEKKLVNALESFAPHVQKDDVLLLIDDTMWGSSKDGCLITKDTIYAKEFMSDPVHREFSAEISFALDGKKLLINGEKFCLFTMAETNALQKIVNGLNKLTEF